MPKKIHIGSIIQAHAEEKGITVAEFARRLKKTNPSIYHIYKSEGINTDLLMQVCMVLEHDFFSYFSVATERAVNEKKEPQKLMISIEVDIDKHSKVLKLLGLPVK